MRSTANHILKWVLRIDGSPESNEAERESERVRLV